MRGRGTNSREQIAAKLRTAGTDIQTKNAHAVHHNSDKDSSSYRLFLNQPHDEQQTHTHARSNTDKHTKHLIIMVSTAANFNNNNNESARLYYKFILIEKET